MNTIEAMNQAIFLWINAGPSTPSWEITTAKLVANQLIYLIPLLLVGLWCWGGWPRCRLALEAFAAVLAALALNYVIGLAWPQPRPFVLGIGHTFFTHAPSPSFPSNHAAIIWSVAAVLIANNWRSPAGWLVVIMGIAVAWARVFLGVHFPLDMLGALVVAVVAASLARVGAKRITAYFPLK